MGNATDKDVIAALEAWEACPQNLRLAKTFITAAASADPNVKGSADINFQLAAAGMVALRIKLDAATAENARLREALSGVEIELLALANAQNGAPDGPAHTGYRMGLSLAANIAFAALNKEPDNA